ncbi:MAG: UDP-N-acetylmuramate dehydrogenase [Cytophagaceae bacterium]
MISIQNKYSVQALTTFGFPCVADKYAVFSSSEELKELVKEIPSSSPILILGGGSNMLFRGDYHGWILHNQCKGIELISSTDEHVTLRVGAGENWHHFVLYCVQHDYAGIENLSLIPGTVGASPIQNIGAYGVEVKDVITQVNGVTLNSLEDKSFNNSECQFGYRDSIFKHQLKGKFVVTSVEFKLSKKVQVNTSYGAIKDTLKEMNIEHPTIKNVSDAVIHIRQSKLPNPAEIGNAGSFFKNPEIPTTVFQSIHTQFPTIPSYPGSQAGYTKIPAGWLIEQSGWKGKRMGAVGVHDKQALVLVHYGNGKGNELVNLSQQIQADVKEKFGVSLEAEVNII